MSKNILNDNIILPQLQKPINDTLFLGPVNKNEIIQYISKLKNNAACGPDGISTVFIKRFHIFLIDPLIHIFNLIFLKGKIPNQFKESIVTPVFKSGNKQLLTNYRPLSVINNFSKLFEYCLKNRLMDHLTHHKILSDNQFGFRKTFLPKMLLCS